MELPSRPQNSKPGVSTSRPIRFSASWYSTIFCADLSRALWRLCPAGVNAPGYSNLPATLNASVKQLAIEKLPSSEQFDLAVRDAKTGFTFFNIEGHQYDYNATAQSLAVVGGRLTISRDFANALGRPSAAGVIAGEISIGAGIQVGLGIATTSCNNGEQPVDWFQLPNTDHPVVPQNLYRMSGGADNTERFEQIGQSWLKHIF